MGKRKKGENDIKGKKRMIEEMTGRMKNRTVESDQWGRKEYIKESNIETIIDVVKIRLHIWDLEVNYGRKSLDIRCKMCQ